MRKSLASLLVAFSLLWAQLAQAQLVVNELTGFGSGGYDTTYGISYLGAITWSSGSTITGSKDIGLLNPQKEIFLVCSITGTSRTLTAASTTVGGSAVTKSTTETSTSSAARSLGFVSLPTLTGTQTITVTYSGTLTSGVCGVFKVLNRPNIGNNETDAANTTTASGTSCAISATTINNNGLWFLGAYHNNTNATTAPSGTISGSDLTSGSARHLIAFRSVQVSGSTPTDTTSWTGTTAGACLSWAFN